MTDRDSREKEDWSKQAVRTSHRRMGYDGRRACDQYPGSTSRHFGVSPGVNEADNRRCHQNTAPQESVTSSYQNMANVHTDRLGVYS
jgi:hypothetical protein